MTAELPLRRQFEIMTTWWQWSEEDRQTWVSYAREHLDEASQFVRLAYFECLRFKRLGIDSAAELLSPIQT